MHLTRAHVDRADLHDDRGSYEEDHLLRPTGDRHHLGGAREDRVPGGYAEGRAQRVEDHPGLLPGRPKQ
jgi:hypothetical protein